MAIYITKKKKTKAKGRIDWHTVRELFISRNVHPETTGQRYTLKDVADDFSITYGSVRNVASREKWDEQLKEAINTREIAVNKRIEQEKQHVQNALQKEEINKEVTVRHRQATVARMLQSKAAGKLTNLNPQDLTIREAIDLMRLGIIEERKALGIADKYEVTAREEPVSPAHLQSTKARAILGRVINLVEQKAGVYEQPSKEPVEELVDAP